MFCLVIKVPVVLLRSQESGNVFIGSEGTGIVLLGSRGTISSRIRLHYVSCFSLSNEFTEGVQVD